MSEYNTAIHPRGWAAVLALAAHLVEVRLMTGAELTIFLKSQI